MMKLAEIERVNTWRRFPADIRKQSSTVGSSYLVRYIRSTDRDDNYQRLIRIQEAIINLWEWSIFNVSMRNKSISVCI